MREDRPGPSVDREEAIPAIVQPQLPLPTPVGAIELRGVYHPRPRCAVCCGTGILRNIRRAVQQVRVFGKVRHINSFDELVTPPEDSSPCGGLLTTKPRLDDCPNGV